MKKLSILLFASFFISCTSSDSENSNEVNITGYKIESSTVPQYRTVITGNLVNNKLFSETYELFNNEVLVEQTTEQKYFYNANGTLNHYKRGDGYITNLYYDANSNLVGAKLFKEGEEGALHFRFVHHSDSVVYYERVNLPYDNPAAVASVRIIVKLNANNEVVTAGRDSNFDGVMENANTFEYNDGNLAVIHYYNGVEENYQYSDIVDNFQILYFNSIGKKNTAILCGESFGYLNQFTNINSSRNILLSVSTEATYEVLPNNFYEFKTEVDGDGRTTVTQFFFD